MDLELVLNIIESITIIIAAISDIYGINSWRRETKWKKKYELAEEALGLFYQAKEGIDHARFPGSSTEEGTSRKIDESETEAETRRLNAAYVPVERLNKISDTFSKLHVLKYNFMAVFGNDTSKPFDELFKIKREIEFSAHMLSSRYWRRHHIERIERLPEKNREFEYNQIEENERIIWARTIDEDPIRDRLNKIIQDVEKICRKVLTK